MAVDYSSFVKGDANGAVWWRTEDAIRLCAGFEPEENRLIARTNRARAAEREILAGLRTSQPLVRLPVEVHRAGVPYVEGADFVNWLSAHCAAVGVSNPCPVGLAREVARWGAGDAPTAAFESLQVLVAPFVRRRSSRLPKDVREQIKTLFFPFRWDELSRENRQRFALSWDRQHDPAERGAREFWFALGFQLVELEEEKKQLESKRGDLAAQKRLSVVSAEIDRLHRKASMRIEVSSVTDIEREAWRSEQATNYLAYPKALEALSERIGATPHEFAAWVFHGPGGGGLRAFLNATEPNPTAFSYAMVAPTWEYLKPLNACWFLKDEIAAFSPQNRYLTGAELIGRWSGIPGVDATEFILAKIAEDRLESIHPLFGATREMFRGDDSFPPLANGLFDRARVAAIEVQDLPGSAIELEETQSNETESDTTAPSGPCISAAQVRAAFVLFADRDRNDRWWKESMRKARKNGLHLARVGAGRKGQGGGSSWSPERVAGWLVDRKKRGRDGLSESAVKAALLKIPGCEALAEQFFSSE